MAIKKLSNFDLDDHNLTAIEESIIKTYKGQAEITLTNYNLDTAPEVKAGAVFDNNGAIFLTDSDITPNGYSGVSSSAFFYLYFDESAPQMLYSAITPIWSDPKQGWYNGNDRAFYKLYKDSGGTLYQLKELLAPKNNFYLSGSIEVGNNINVDGSIENDGDSNNEGIVKWRGYKNEPGSTIAFDFISTLVPNVGDRLPCFGWWFQGYMLGLYRATSNSINISGYTESGVSYDALISDTFVVVNGYQIMSNMEIL